MSDLRNAMLALLAETHFQHNVEEDYFVALEGRLSTELRERIRLDAGRCVLDVWHDLYREGLIAWGASTGTTSDRNNAAVQLSTDIHRGHLYRGRPWYRLTDRGRQAVTEGSRDPSNAAGYLAHVDPWLPTDGIARSYVEEALKTYRMRCDCASTFLLGGATESLTRRLAARLKRLGGNRANLDHTKIKTVIEAIRLTIDDFAQPPTSRTMPGELRERWDGVYPSLAHFIRATRNDVGHPAKLDPVDHADAHGMFLAFACLAELIRDVAEWLEPNTWVTTA